MEVFFYEDNRRRWIRKHTKEIFTSMFCFRNCNFNFITIFVKRFWSLNASFLIIYPNGIVLLVIVKKFIELFRSLKDNNPFCDKNVKILKFTGNSALVGAILWLLDLIYAIVLVKISDIVIIMFLAFLFVLFLGVSIALYILSELLKEATEYKKENELTI